MALVTIEQIKALGRIDYDSDDVLLALLIDEAESFAEAYCDITLTSTAFVERIDGGLPYLWCRHLPITAVTSVIDKWSDPVYTMETEEYFFVDTKIVAELEDEFSAGELRWQVSYTAGYTAATAPKGLLSAIRELVLLSYTNPSNMKRQMSLTYTTDWHSLAEKNNITMKLDMFSLRRYVE
jgi:hypothetical protein